MTDQTAENTQPPIDIHQLPDDVRNALRGMMGPTRIQNGEEGFLLFEHDDIAVCSPDKGARNMWTKFKVTIVVDSDNNPDVQPAPEDEQLMYGSLLDQPDTVNDLIERGILVKADNIACLTSTAEQQVINMEATEPDPDNAAPSPRT